MKKFDMSEVQRLLEGVREKYFAGKATMPGIYYCNGNDGTDFDWRCNNRVCEFYILKADEDGSGLAKLLCWSGGDYTIYVYDYDEPFSGKYEELHGELNLDTYELACYLQGTFDDQNIYDEVVTSWELDKRSELFDDDDFDLFGFDDDEDDDDDDDEDEDW